MSLKITRCAEPRGMMHCDPSLLIVPSSPREIRLVSGPPSLVKIVSSIWLIDRDPRTKCLPVWHLDFRRARSHDKAGRGQQVRTKALGRRARMSGGERV